MTTHTRGDFVQTSPGVELRILRHTPAGGMTFLVRMAAGAHAPVHGHPGGEESYIIEGKLQVRNRVDATGQSLPNVDVAQGEYLYAEPGEQHDGFVDVETLFFVVAPGGLELTSSPARRKQ